LEDSNLSISFTPQEIDLMELACWNLLFQARARHERYIGRSLTDGQQRLADDMWADVVAAKALYEKVSKIFDLPRFREVRYET
jgi:hypothetical protein